MTTEFGNSDASRAAERRGLSRRQMIKASAVAGAAAWTAPVIIDSLASPAAAGSVCVPYWVKALPSTTEGCFGACPGDATLFPLNDPAGAEDYRANFAGDTYCTNPVCSSGMSAANRMPTTIELDGANYWKVTLLSTCSFRSAQAPNVNDWQIGGRYPASSLSFLKATATGSSAPASGNGCYTDGGQTAWISRYLTPGNNTTTAIDYIYLKFCCDS